MKTLPRFGLFARVLPPCLLGLLLTACGSSPAPRTDWQPPNPGFSSFETAVAEQLASERAATVRVLAEPATDGTRAGAAAARLGMHYEAYELANAAMDCYGEAVVLDPGNADWWYLLGRALDAAGRFSEAGTALESALQRRPGDPAVLLALAEVRLTLGSPEPAGPLFREASRHAEARAAAEFGLGRVALALDEPAAARTAFEAALELEPRADAINYPLGLAYRKLGEMDKAMEWMSRRGTNFPSRPDPLAREIAGLIRGWRLHQNRGTVLLEAGRLEEAAVEFANAAAAAPNSPVPRHNFGATLARLGRMEEARAALEEARRLDPSNSATAYSLGTVLASLGDHGGAVNALRDALVLDPGSFEAQFNLGNSLRELGRFEAALDQYRAATAIRPADATARRAGVLCLLRLQRWGEALQASREATAVVPEEAWFSLAIARLLAAAPEESLRDGPAALALSTELLKAVTSAENVTTYAMALAEVGRFEEAVSLQERVAAAVTSAGDVARAAWLRGLAQGYAEGRPCREPWRHGDPELEPRSAP